MISVRKLTKSFGSNLILKDISVDIHDGEVIAVIGQSGCGKSTFIRCINLLERPDSGQIFIGNEEITGKNMDINTVRRKLGMVYQSFNLFSHKTVLENVILSPLHVLKLPLEQAVKEAMDYLEMVGIANRADFLPDQLSGGQKQRVAIARCLAMHPEAILFDEPTSALDPTMVDEVLSVIRKLVRKGLTCVIVTHEMNFTRKIASRVFYMDDKSIYESGTPDEIFDHPRREKTRTFINKLKVLIYESVLAEIDMYDVTRLVTEYCFKYDISQRETTIINLICEEYINNLMRRPANGERLILSVRYNEQSEIKEIMFQDNFPPGNFLAGPDFDPVSARLIQGFTTSLDYRLVDGQNVFEMKIA
ncbi:MAG: amino acid ABC transporter ATP-binding protein [Deltaproteobacteria bacterium]|nr:amino acid ABC transporter ATP-binding protein [Deltaproteobacteria bacterium]